jgi:hypothetical protein
MELRRATWFSKGQQSNKTNMKKLNLLLLAAVLCLGVPQLIKLRADEPATFQRVEFAAIRWDGRENTYLIRPNGTVERFKPVFAKAPPRPDGIDERAYYMTIAMNAIAKEGFDFAGMAHDQCVMKRTISRQ